jgi:hypothetical protein
MLSEITIPTTKKDIKEIYKMPIISSKLIVYINERILFFNIQYKKYIMTFLQKLSFCKFIRNNPKPFSSYRRKRILIAVSYLIIYFKKSLKHIYSRNNTKIIFSSIILLIGCNPQELKIKEVIPCEYSLQNGECEISLKEKKEYNVMIPKDSKIESWNQLSNYIYFKSRISAGFIIKFNRPLLFKEKETILSSYKSFYNFNGLYGSIDGFDIGDDYIYSFIYLGSLLKEKQKEKKEDNKSFGKFQSIPFPVTLGYKSDLFSGELQTSQEIKVSKE